MAVFTVCREYGLTAKRIWEDGSDSAVGCVDRGKTDDEQEEGDGAGEGPADLLETVPTLSHCHDGAVEAMIDGHKEEQEEGKGGINPVGG
jgi:hypothetical protein